MKANESVTKEQLCKEIVDRMMKEAKDEALHIFHLWKKRFPLEFEYSSDSKLIVTNRILNHENPKYNKELNIKDIRNAKDQMFQLIIRSKEIFDDEQNFILNGYEAQKQVFIDQFVVLRKIEFLKKKAADFEDKIVPEATEKVDWFGSPSQLAYLILQLMDKTYMENDGKGKGQKSLRKIARIIYDTFYIPNQEKTGETTFENFYKEMRQNSLTSGAREWIKITKQK